MFNMWSIGCIVRIVKMTLNNCMLITLVGYLLLCHQKVCGMEGLEGSER